MDGEAPRFRPHRARRLRPAPNGLQVMLRSLFGPPAHHFTCSTLAPGRRVFACAARIVVFSFDSGLPGRADARGALRRLFFSARGQLGRAQGVRRGAQHPSHPPHAQPTSRPTMLRHGAPGRFEHAGEARSRGASSRATRDGSFDDCMMRMRAEEVPITPPLRRWGVGASFEFPLGGSLG